jgi:hypothetical protein
MAQDHALDLLSEDAEASKQKLYLRKSKASIHLGRYDQAKTAIEGLNDGDQKKALEECCGVQHAGVGSLDDSEAAHAQLILDLPRYKPQV